MIKIFFDGAIKFNPDRKTGKIAYSYIIKKEDVVLFQGSGFGEEGTVPKAEYCGLILGLSKALSEGIKEFEVFGDSQLICYQVEGKYRCDNEQLKPFYEQAKILICKNKINWFRRENNSEADIIAKERLQEELKCRV